MSVRRTLAELRPKAEIRGEVHRQGKSGVCNDGEEILARDQAGITVTPPKPQRSGATAEGRLGCRTDLNTGADAGASLRLANRRVAITAGIITSRLLLPLLTIESCASPNLTLGVFTDLRPFGWMVAFFISVLRAA